MGDVDAVSGVAARPSTPALDQLRVSEVFGPTVQGEGPYTGRSCWFVRLMGCNLSCSWCDTAFTWDADRHDLRAETTHATVADILATIEGDAGLVVLSGGEPLLQQGPVLVALLDALRRRGATIQVETNGTIAPSASMLAVVDTWVVSPKLGNAGTHRGHQDPRPQAVWSRIVDRHDAHLKIVCRDSGDVDTVARLADQWGWRPGRVWVMPEGTTADVLADRFPPIAEAARAHGLNVSHRLHVLAWGEERGR